MALTSAYLAALKKGEFKISEVLEVGLDSGTAYWGTHRPRLSVNVEAIVESMSSLQNRLDTKDGWGTRGTMTFVIGGRDIFKPIVANEYLKNRRVTRKQGFIESGFAYADYYTAFTGKISEWKRDGDKLTLTVMDDSYDTTKKIPAQNAAKTQYLDYTNENILDVASNMLLTQAGIGAGYVDSAQFTAERDTWLAAWTVSRVITEPREAKEYLNELQQEGNFFLLHTGAKISCKVFAPPVPSVTVEEWTAGDHILDGSFKLDGGYKDNFYNSIEVLYDYDESGSDGEENFESAYIAGDTDSQGSGQWGEVKTKTIKSKWLRSLTHSPVALSSITGVVVYQVSLANGAGSGTLAYTASTNSITWTPPGGTVGEAVKLSKNGRYQVYGADKNKYVRIIATTASLPGGDQSEAVVITAITGPTLAATLANKLLSRFRDPAATATFEIGLNSAVYNSEFVKPTDLKDITTDWAFEHGAQSWNAERCMVTMVRPKGRSVEVEVLETKMYRRYGFIAPAGYPDYGSATAEQRKRAFIGDGNNKVNGGTENGYFIW